jgi:hypothetical protein
MLALPRRDASEPAFHPIVVFVLLAKASDMAEGEGFEPSIRSSRIHTFQACALSLSATLPERAQYSGADLPFKDC